MGQMGEDAAQRLEAAMADLLRTVEGVGEAAVHKLPREGEWSAMQTLAHVAEMVPFWAKRVADIAAQRRGQPTYDRTPAEYAQRNAAIVEHGQDTLEQMLQRLRASLAEGAALLRSIPDEGWSRTARHGELGVDHSVSDIVQNNIVGHVQAHARQTAEAASGGREG